MKSGFLEPPWDGQVRHPWDCQPFWGKTKHLEPNPSRFPAERWQHTGLNEAGKGRGLGAQVKWLGAESRLLSDAQALRFFSFGVTDLDSHWKIAPAVMAEYSKDRFNKAQGGFYNLTMAPTFKLDTGLGFFSRPELRLFGTYMGWDKSLNNFTYTSTASDTFGNTTFTGSSKWLMGAQMEVWF